MQRRRLGDTALVVSSVGLGTAALATTYGPPGSLRAAPDRVAAARTIDRAVQAGITFIDTAPAYGEAEAIVGEVCGGEAGVEVATKLAIPPVEWGSLSDQELDDHVRRSVEQSLSSLRRPRIDLLQVHNADVPVLAAGRVLAAMRQLRAENLIGACGVTVYGEENALAASARPEVDAIQIAYSALDRRPERAVVPAATGAGKALVLRSILLRGALSPAARALTGPFAPVALAAERFRSVAGAGWEDLPGAAVAYALSRPWSTSTLLGPRDEQELEDLLAGAARYLDAARALQGDWDRDLTADLLDPSRWPPLAG